MNILKYSESEAEKLATCNSLSDFYFKYRDFTSDKNNLTCIYALYLLTKDILESNSFFIHLFQCKCDLCSIYTISSNLKDLQKICLEKIYKEAEQKYKKLKHDLLKHILRD